MGTNTFKLQVAGITKTASVEVVEDILFSVQFERKRDYKGEFGFDWMRDNYQTVSQNYEELKKEYKDAQINGSEYFVPYLSMLPNQDNVILNFKLDVLEGKAHKDDIIKLPAKDGIKFKPNKISLKDLQKEQEAINKEKAKGYDGDVSKVTRVEVKVICENPLSQDTSIELLDKNDNPVGEIIVVKNDEVNTVKIKFIKVMSNEPGNTYNKKTFGQMPNGWVKSTIQKFNTKYFNQSLIKAENGGLEEMIIDVESYENKGVLETLVINGVKGIPRYNNGFDRELYKEYVQNNGEYGGVIFFLSAFQQKDGREGHAKLYPTELNYILMTPGSVGSENVNSFAHELGHTLGLDHTWATKEENTKRLETIEKTLLKQKTYLEKYKTYPDSTPVKGSTKTLKDVRERKNNYIKELESEKASRLTFIPKHPFNKATTENVMDYNGYDVPGGETIHNPNSEGISFWKWQWDIMTNEVKQYHGG
ncbi:reprolysin-like metallopeptidase [uncultured Aquimarina sp.]|uniref:reprolysin-like metallopeptidase n=1 Tax=uncultured Aquimarina sp. TaxID=575652 RepID=UPI00261545F2|nr:hypothetical protein [uncultured Aquimarina sp.]